MNSVGELRVAIVGCAAVAELVHLPALASIPHTAVAILVDKDIARARRLAEPSGARVTDDYRDVIGAADAAIVALPHHLHAPVAIDLLRGGVHVLVEKPMALRAQDCDDMIAAAEASGRLLAVGLLRRFHDALRFAKQAIDARVLGDLQRVEIREGSAYRWKVATDAMFRPPAGGVLADAGAHALDLLAWWFGDGEVVSYRDDAMGGVEADCEVRLRLPGGVEAFVELSRTRSMPNICVLTGTRGRLEVGTKTDSMVRIALGDGRIVMAAKPVEAGARPPASLVDLGRRQLEDFVSAIRHGREPYVTGRHGRGSVALIESCYPRRQPLEYSWETQDRTAPLLPVEV
jgi:predicted dehydrogenase